MLKTRFTAIVIFALILLSATSCTDDRLRKAAKADADIAAGINAAIKLKRELAKEKKISVEEELSITKALFVLNAASAQFHNEVENHKEWNENTRAALIRSFANVTAALNDLIEKGVIVKDDESRLKIQAALSLIRASTVIIEGILK